jgi:hypothetical protein
MEEISRIEMLKTDKMTAVQFPESKDGFRNLNKQTKEKEKLMK